MLWVPNASVLVPQAALPLLSGTALQPLNVVPSLVKLTLPVGLLPVTVAVKVTLAPAVAGFCELLSVVVDDVSV